MSKPIPNKIRCKKCMYFEKLHECIGICKRRSHGCTIYVRPNQQIKNCFVKRGNE